MVRYIVSLVVAFIVPPRSTELLVRSLTLETLRALRAQESLPYHEPRITALVWEAKYHRNRHAVALCGALLAEMLMEYAEEELGTPLVVPVPMHPSRRRERGYNQTDLLCRAALPALAGFVEYAPEALARTADRPPQRGLPRAQRLRNAANTMEASSAVAGRACLVVDDVTTTGATLAEATRALRAAGARSVRTIALARS